LKRRTFITLLGGAAAWLLAARGQQPAMLVIGYLSGSASADRAHVVAPFWRGLREPATQRAKMCRSSIAGRRTNYDRLPDLAADLVRRKVEVIAATDTPSAVAAKAANTPIPIVFAIGGDPVSDGLVISFNRPGGNLTGISFMSVELGAKQLGLLRELVPMAARIAVLVDPNFPITERFVSGVRAASSAIGQQIEVLYANTGRDIDAAFASLAQKPVDALLVSPAALFVNRRVQLAILAANRGMPAIYSLRQAAEAGGLMSYGTSLTDAYRQAGIYTGRILKGEKAADLPILQPTKFDFVINLNTARVMGLSFPPGLLAIADEVIE